MSSLQVHVNGDVPDLPTAELKALAQKTRKITRDEVRDRIGEDAIYPIFDAEEFVLYGKASIEQRDKQGQRILMSAIEGGLDRFFESTKAPGIISRGHDDVPVGIPLRDYTIEGDRVIPVNGEAVHLEEGTTVRSEVIYEGEERPDGEVAHEDALWLVSDIAADTQKALESRLHALAGDLNGYSVTVFTTEEEVDANERVSKEVDFHAVTLGTDEQIVNPGTEFGVVDYKAEMGGATHTDDAGNSVEALRSLKEDGMNLTKKFRELFGPSEQKQVQAVQGLAANEGLTFKSASKNVAQETDDAEALAQKALDKTVDEVFGSAIDQKADECDNLRESARRFLTILNSADHKLAPDEDVGAELANCLVQKSCGDDHLEQKDKEVEEEIAKVAEAYGLDPDKVHGMVESAVEEQEAESEETEQKADTDNTMPEGNNEDGEEEKNPLDMLDDDVQEAIEDLAEKTDQDPVAVAESQGLVPNASSGGMDEGVDEKQEAGEDENVNGDEFEEGEEPSENYEQKADGVTEEELDQKLEEFKSEITDDLLEAAEQKADFGVETPEPDASAGEGEKTVGDVMFGGDN